LLDSENGSGFGNLNSDPGLDNISLGAIFTMLFLSSIFYFIITLYFEAILPSEFGVRKPWYFLFQVI
jgi:hypothetical protein